MFRKSLVVKGHIYNIFNKFFSPFSLIMFYILKRHIFKTPIQKNFVYLTFCKKYCNILMIYVIVQDFHD